MERNIADVFYKLALFIGTFMLTNFAIGSEQLKLYIYYINKETYSFIHKAKKMFSFRQYFPN